MKSTDYLKEAARKMRESADQVGDNDAGWTKDTSLAVAEWLEEESQAELDLGPDSKKKLYDMPGMSTSPAVVMAKSFLGENK